MDLSSTPRPPVRRRRRLLIAAATAVSSILFVRYGPLNHHYYKSEASSAPREKSQRIHRLEELPTQPQQHQPQEHQRRRLDECYIATNNWHLTMSGKNTCSNDDNFPGGWSNTTMPRFFQPTCTKCCEQMFPRLPLSDCSCIDVCNTNTEDEEEDVPCATTDDPCCDRYWHIDLTAKFTCSNTYSTDGTYYPPGWNNNELMVGTTMFKTVEDCCYKITNGDVDKCVMVEAEECKTTIDGDTTSGDTPSPTPIPTTASPTSRPTTSSPTSRPTLHLTIPPHLIPQPTTPQPTLHITIPPHLLKPDPTPQPTLHITIPPHLLKPPTNPPQDIMVPQSAPVQLQNDCSRRRRRKGCERNTSCEWIRSKRSCLPKINVIVNDESSTTTSTTTTTTTVAATEPPNTNNDAAVCTEGFKWHRGKPSEGSKCTNDFNYPSAWDDPQHTDRHLFDTPEKCCLAHFTLESCTVINACGEEQTLDDSSSSSSAQNDALVSMSEAIPNTGSSSSSNCSNKRRKKCKIDPNCRWRRAPHRKCVDA